MNSLNSQQLTTAKKIESEKRKRHQLYNTLDYVLSNTTYFDFFSKDCFSVIKNAKIFAYLFSRSKLTTDLLLLSFFETDSKKTIDEISMKTGFTTDEVIRWHAEFLVSFLAHYGEYVDFLIFFY